MSTPPDFSTFAAENAPQFARTAYLLTGDQDRARELTTQAFIRVGRQWSSARWQPIDAMLRQVYRGYLESPAPPGSYFPLAGLTPIRRAALVARYHDGLHPQRAAQVCGLWAEASQIEWAREELRAAHPELFAAPGTPPEEAGRRGRADDAPLPRADETAASSPWAAPWSSQAVAGHEASTGEAGPDAAGPSGSGAWTADQPGYAAGPSGPRAWAAPVAADQPGYAEEPGLHVALVQLSSVMAGSGIAEVVVRSVRRHRRIRRAVVTAVSTSVAASALVLVFWSLTTIAENADRLNPTSGHGNPTPSGWHYFPDSLPDTLYDPISYAYTGYCGDSAEGTPDKPRPCAQWRLVTDSGDEWRLEGARAGYDEGNDVSMPLALSQDGKRVVYLSEDGDYAVRDLSTDTIKTFHIPSGQVTAKAKIVSSPDGRYFAISFPGTTPSMVLDFKNGETSTLNGNGVLAISDDGRPVVTDTKDVTDVPGHASVTTLSLSGSDGHGSRPYRIDPSLISHGGALSPDGRTLALVTGDGEFVTMDARTGKVADRTPVLRKSEVTKVERWIGANEVLVRLWVDDYASLVTVNPETGRMEEYENEVSEDLDYEGPLGALTE